MLRVLSFHTQIFAGCYFLWLGLYILTREMPFLRKNTEHPLWKSNSALFASTSLILTSWFMFGVAMRSVTPIKETYILWQQLTWWPVPIAIASWFRCFMLLPAQKETSAPKHSRLHFVSLLLILYALFLAGFGTFSELVFQYSVTEQHLTAVDYYLVPPVIPTHHLYSAFLIVTLWSVVVLSARQYVQNLRNTQQKKQVFLLLIGSTLTTLGATMSLVGYINLRGLIPEQFGDLVVTAGIALIGQSIVNYNALLKNRVIKADYQRSFRTVATMIALYFIGFNAVHWLISAPIPPLSTALIAYLITLTTTSFKWTQHILNKWTLPDWESTLLTQVSDIKQNILTAPDQHQALVLAQQELLDITQTAQAAQMREIIFREICTIFRHKAFQKDSIMGNSRLLELRPVQKMLWQFAQPLQLTPENLSESERAQVLRQFLVQFIEGNYIPAQHKTINSGSLISDRWIEFTILHESYLQGRTRQEIVQTIQQKTGLRLGKQGNTGGRRYTQHLESARLHLTDLLWNECIQL